MSKPSMFLVPSHTSNSLAKKKMKIVNLCVPAVDEMLYMGLPVFHILIQAEQGNKFCHGGLVV